ncbi:putative pectinesterase/pectinesterase inhibitor 51 [Acorus calamus]|uniref:Pectinesterase n=1 Tax=Acorus calamus TaxID=4465 RepID=A0AAV9EHQ1_ACOCL|nr:putative pectinesterase/pectinesterase inhibitor 51 [Acorus calamus]
MSLLFLSLLLLLSLSLTSPKPLSHNKPPKPVSSQTQNQLILQACQATRTPDTCASSLTSPPSDPLPPNPTTADLISLSLSLPIRSLPAAQSMSQSILQSSQPSNLNKSNAARNCLELLSFSATRLNSTAQILQRGGDQIKTSRAYTSAALLYQYDCWSALKYVNDSQQVNATMSYLLSLIGFTSDSLSMLVALDRSGPDTSRWGPPKTERDGYFERTGSGGGLAEGGVPGDLVVDATVCKGGGCEYRTVQDAVDRAPVWGDRRFVIYIKAGVYDEIVRVPFERTNVVFLGEGMGKTVITGNLNVGMVGVSTYNTATVGVSGDGFMAKDLTIENTAGPDAHQAVAFRSDSDLSVIESVEFRGHQDTLYAHSLRQYYKSCLISGTVDFIFGNSASVFQNSTLLIRPRQLSPEKGETDAVTAQGRTDPAQSTGFVFLNCSIDGDDEFMGYFNAKPTIHKVYLGRPWKEFSRTVFVDCYMGKVVRPEGWLPWLGDFALKTLYYGEYGSFGPGGNTTGRVSWSSQVPMEHVDIYSVDNFIQGSEWIPSQQ